MNKKIIYSIVILLVVAVAGFYFLIYKKNNSNSLGLSYQEPNPHFFDKSLVRPGDVVVKITDNSFDPNTIKIKKRDKVTWVNDTGGYAWPASNPHPTHTDYPGFDPGLPMRQNQAWSFTFDKVGNWGYHDHLAPEKQGTVNVSE